MDNKTIKVLLVDDEPELREVLSDILKVKGFEPVPAETGAAALARIEQQDLDVALIDLRLEDMSGLEVLRGLKTRSPETECIMLTGHSSQTAAIEAINLGAYAYFQKPYDVEQLLVAIRRAAEKHTAEHALQESEARFRSMIENSSDLICILNPDATLRYISPSVERLMGYTKEDIVIGTGLRDYIHPDDIYAFVEAFRQRIQASDSSPVPMRLRVLNKKGTWRTLEGTGSNLLDHPAIKGIIINARDITEREQAEEAIMKQSQDIALINRLNQALNQGLSLTDYVQTLSEEFTRLFLSSPCHLYLLEGEKQFLVSQGSFSSEKAIGQIERLIGMSIPPIKLPVGSISLYSRAFQEKKVLLCNDSEAIQEMMAEYAQVLLPEKLRSRVKKFIPKVSKILGDKEIVILPLLAGDEPIGILEVPSKAPFSDEDLGRIEIIAGQLTAAILRKRAEDALRQSMGLLESIFAGLHTLVAYLDADFNFIRVNQAYAAADDQSPEYFIGKNHFDLFPNPENEAIFKEAVRSGKPYSAYAKPFEYTGHPERGVSYWDWTVSPVKDERGKVSNIILSLVNVTERKRAEDAERQAEIRYSSLFAQTHDAIFILDLEGRHLDANLRAAEMLGYTREEILNLSFKEISVQLPESQQVMKRLLAGEHVPLYERIFRKKNGDLIPVELNVELVRDAGGQPLHILSVARDITARKESERALQRQLQELTLLHAVAIHASAAEEEDALVEQVTAMIGQTFYPDNFGFLMLNEAASVLRPHHSYHGEKVSLDIEFSIGQGIIGRTAADGKPRRIVDVAQATGYLAVFPGMHSELAVPLKVGERVIGVINAESHAVNAFSEADERLLTTLAGQVATAIERLRLHRETLRHLRELQALLEVSQAVTSAIELEPLLQNVLDAAVTVVPAAEKGCILLPDPAGNLQIRAMSGYHDRRILGSSFPPTSGYSARAFRERQPLIIAEARRDDEIRYDDEIEEMVQIQSAIVTPLMAQDQPIGVIALDNATRAEAFTESDLRLLTTIAASVSVAIQNARLFEQAHQEIAERKQAEEALRRSESSLQAVLQSTADGILAVGSENEVLYANERFVEMWRIPQAVVASKDDSILLQHVLDQLRDPQSFLEKVQELYKSKEESFDTLYFKDGRVFERLSRPLLQGTTVQGRVWSFRDITERKQAEESLRHAEARYRSIVEQVPAVLYTESLDHRAIFISSKIETVLGYTPEEWKSAPGFWKTVVHPGDLERAEAEDNRTSDSGEPFQAEYRAIRKDGRIIWLRDQASLIKDEGKPIFWQGIMYDISAEKESEAALRASEERYRMLAENMSDTVWLMDMNLRTTYISPSVTRLRGFTLEEINSIPLDRQMPPDSFQRAFQLFAETLSPENLAQTDQPVSRTIELEFYKKDGTKFWSENTFTLICDPQGQPIAILGSGRDTSERKQAEEEIRRRVGEFTALYESSKALAGKISLDDVLKNVTESALRLFGVTGVGMYLYDPVTTMLEIKLATHPSIPIGTRLSLGEGLAGKVAQTRRSMRIDDYAAWEGRSPKYKGIPVRATLEAPLIYQDELIGVLVVHETGDSERKFTEADERLLSLFAAQAAAAIQNARLFEQTRRQVADLEVLYENGLIVSGLLDPKEIAQKMIEILSKKLDWHHAAIRLYHPDTKRVELLALNKPGLNPDETQAEIDRLNTIITWSSKGLSGWVIKHGKTIRIGDVQADKRYLSTFPEIRSGIYVPLMIGERAIGSIAVESRQANRFSEEDERLLKTLAAQSAITFENARLYQEAVSAAKRKAALHQGGLEIVRAGQEIEALCLALHHAAQQVMPAEAFTVCLLTEDGREVEAPYLFDHGIRHPNTRLPAGAGITGRVLKSKKPLRIKDVQQTRGVKPIMVDGSEPTRAVLSVPLLAQDKIIGVISAQSRESDVYSLEDQIFMETLASEAAVAFENSRLFEETRRRVEELGVLASVSAALRIATKRDEMLPVILDQVLSLFNADGAALAFRDAITGETVVEQANGVLLPFTHMRIPPGAGASGYVAKTRQPYLSHNITSDKYVYLPENMPELQDMAFAPLIVQEEVIGVLVAGRKTRINESEMKLLVAVADISANAIHRTTLYEQTAQHAEQLININAMGRILTETLDTSAIYHRLTGAIYQLLPDTCAVFISLYNENSAQIVCACAHSDGAFINHETLPPTPVTHDGKGRQSQVILTGKPFIANDLANNIPTTPRTLVSDQNKPAQSGLYVPMIAQGKVIGILQAQSYTAKRFGEPEQELLTLVANTAAVAIENARLFAETQQRLHRLSALHSIDAAIGASVDTHVTLSIVLEHVITELKADAAAVLLFNPFAKILEYAAGRGFRAHILEGLRLRLGESLAGQSALQRRAISIADLQQPDAMEQVLEHPVSGSASLPLQYLEGENFVAYHAIPLIAKGQVQGVLEIFRRTPMQVDQEWNTFFEMLAGQTAIAIDNGRLFENLQHSNLELTLAYDATIQGWSQALELRDEETEGHTRRVTDLTLRLIQAMGIEEAEMEHARRGALLHDIGKIAIPDSILLKPGPLDEREWSVMRQHPQYAYDLLSPVIYLRPALHIPWCHHEKWDGSGYPRGLKGEEIPMVARIFAIVDVYDALTSNRPYRLAWTRENALEYIREQSGIHFDPRVTKAFMDLMAGEEKGR